MMAKTKAKKKAAVKKAKKGKDWSERWADGTVTSAGVFAAVDAMTPEEQLAEAMAFVEGSPEFDGDMDEAREGLLGDVHLRCYVAMIRARDRGVAADEPCDCFKTGVAACPECRVGAGTDECFMCGGCGAAYADCECSDAERAANPRHGRVEMV